jgi:regulator of replication initiation timing
MATGRPLVVQFDRNHIRRNLSLMVDDFESLSEKLARTTTECARLREENLRLRELLDEARGQPREPLIESPETQQRSHVESRGQ